MRADIALQMLGELLWMGLIIAAPILGLTMLIGVLISILQVVTQVQEMSLTFVPKLAMAVGVLIVAGPWMLRSLTAFCARLWASIPALV